jgi:hypothetical protein
VEIISLITAVFTEVFSWLKTAITSVLAIFYTPGVGDAAGSLTVLGILALIALAVSIFFLLMGLIQNFFHLRG